jgi:hypothetical protein
VSAFAVSAVRAAGVMALVVAAGAARADSGVAAPAGVGVGVGAGAGASVVIGPYVQDVGEAGFVVAFETSGPVGAETVVEDRRVRTEGVRHEARFTGLRAARRYRYSVEIGGTRVASAEVTTAPEPGARRPLTFVVYGDNRNGPETERRLVEAARREGAELLLHTGDMVADGENDDDWLTFFSIERALLAELPVFTAVGNHELHGDPTASHFRRFFVLPERGRERLYYTFRWGPARFIALDGNGRFAEQAAWLAEVLSAAEAAGERDVFVFLHQPPLSTGRHCGAGTRQAEWVALFERYKVRAVFAGHDHAYARMERNGVRYFVSGGGGAPQYDERMDCNAADVAARRAYSPEHHYLVAKLRGDELEITVKRLDAGAPPLAVVVDRRPGGKVLAAELVASFGAPTLGEPAPRATRARLWWIASGVVVAAALLVLVARRRA